ncbi:MAG: TfoX/Sxy family protein [Armatimonadetes bacterium]|nr:TfoX/Sxy family protein [Armatimonadota bacterium]
MAEERLGAVAPITSRSLFGGIGIYSEGLFFAILDDDQIFLKVDDTTRPAFIKRGMGPFSPPGMAPMKGYFELPKEVLTDSHELALWVRRALKVALDSKSSRSKRKR